MSATAEKRKGMTVTTAKHEGMSVIPGSVKP